MGEKEHLTGLDIKMGIKVMSNIGGQDGQQFGTTLTET